MCGIAGELNWLEEPDREAVERMTARLRHRGPDASGLLHRGPVVLGHRRLSVIDTSETSNQPLSDHSGRVWIVFNGEIYNYREIRKELVSLGAKMKTKSDTEVIVEAYKTWGDSCLERLNGMFAFALWDEDQRRLLMARDRAGEKPLYYQVLDQGLIFSSDLQSLRSHPRASRSVDPIAIGHFLSLNYTLTDRCILKGVSRLPAAHYLVAERGRPIRRTHYWDLSRHFHDKHVYRDPQEAARELSTLLEDAVRIRMRSDVPLGAFLSGGLDSSTVVELMLRHSRSGVKTFSLGFAEKSFSELPHAREVADFLGADHHEKIMPENVVEDLSDVMRASGEPFADTSIIPFYHLAKFAREHVTVSLSGDGSDEILAGYETYTADRLRHRTAWIPDWLVSTLERALYRVLPVSFDKVSFDYKVRQFLSGHGLDHRRAHHHWRVIHPIEIKQDLLRQEYSEAATADGMEIFNRHYADVADCHYIDQAMYVDIKTWLVDDILFKVDRATMAHSLESRAPFLDHRLIELAAALPVNLKLRSLETKYLLKFSQRSRLPAKTIHRSKKGFSAPVNHWFNDGLKAPARKLFAESSLFDWLEPHAVDKLWEEHHTRARDHGFRLFTLMSLAFWMRESGL